jgi:hypothetical protein
VTGSKIKITDSTVEAKVKLSQGRILCFHASVVLNNTTLWVTARLVRGVDGTGTTKSTEFVQLTGTRPGPDLPFEVDSPCLVSLNYANILLIGGELATFYYNIDHKTWTEGPLLITERSWHSCALFKSSTVIVTGMVARMV